MLLVKNLEPSLIPQLFEFYRETYPERSNVLEEYMYRITQLPAHADDISKSKIVIDDDKIVAANMILPFRMHGKKDELLSFCWSFDTLVSEKYQKTDAGLLLLDAVLPTKWWIGIGLSDVAVYLHKRIKSNFIGKKKRYVFVNIYNVITFRLFRRLLQKVPDKKIVSSSFPERIRIKDGIFVKIENPTDLKTPVDGIWNPEIVEPLRDPSFLTRRFFHFPKPYVFYQLESPNSHEVSYFVVCPIHYKKAHLLLLVDFRSHLSKPEELTNILLAGKQLTKRLQFDGFVFETTLKSYHHRLRRMAFFPQSSAEIVTNNKKIKTGEVLNFTTADSDGDFHLSS